MTQQKLRESNDYKVRFVREYWETFRRLTRLQEFIVKYKEGKLSDNVKTPIEIFKRQEKAMEEYLSVLETRAKLEGIPLTFNSCS